MAEDQQWESLKLDLPAGTIVWCTVVHHARFGFFVEPDGRPGANALVLGPSFERPGLAFANPEDFPPVGARCQAEVIGHVDPTHQLRLAVRPHMTVGPVS